MFWGVERLGLALHKKREARFYVVIGLEATLLLFARRIHIFKAE